jgi:hypothetical protein
MQKLFVGTSTVPQHFFYRWFYFVKLVLAGHVIIQVRVFRANKLWLRITDNSVARQTQIHLPGTSSRATKI